MAKFVDKCKICGNYFTNYDTQPTQCCSVLCQVTNVWLDEPFNDIPVGKVRIAKSIKVREDK
jgi:hypothetical protein